MDEPKADEQTTPSDSPSTASDDQQDLGKGIDQALDQAEQGLKAAAEEGVGESSGASSFSLPELGGTDVLGGDGSPLEMLSDVEMDLRIELGRTQLRLDEVLHLREGSVVALDKLAGDPVDVYANGRLIARGEVLVMNENFCVRVTELVGAPTP